jgi:tetratricopeptide (TPR) repeat protein
MGNLKANTICNIGLTLWSSGDNTGAMEYYLKSLAMFEKLEDLDGQANLMMNLGIIARSTGKFGDCLYYTGKAYDLNCRLGDIQGQCRTLVGIGNTHRYTGLYEKAIESYNTALDIAVRIGDRNTQSIVKTNIADVFVLQKMYREAEGLYTAALEICEEIGDKEGEGENLALLGDVYRHLDMPDDAISLIQRSISLLEEIGADGRTAMPRLNLAQSMLDRGTDPETLGEAMDQARAVEGFVTPHMNELTEILFTLSKLYRRLAGIPAAGNSKMLERRSQTFIEDAYRSMMSIARTIDDPALRESFLNVDLHRRTALAKQEID